MNRRIFIANILILFLAGCASSPPPWYSKYDIPDRSSLTKTEYIPKIMNALEDEDPETRSHAAEVLGNFGPKAREAICKLYVLRTEDVSGTVRLFSHHALKEICPDEYDGLNLKLKELNSTQ
jgi:hypothetical protein